MRIEIIVPEKTTGKAFFKLLDSVEYLGHIIPEGFVTDGSSTPRLVHSLFPPIDTYFVGAILHDFLLEEGYGWEYANDKFEEALEDFNVPLWKRIPIMLAVRFTGSRKKYIDRYPRTR